MPVDIVTGDRDLFQLAEDARPTTVLYIGKGFAKVERVTDAVRSRAVRRPRRLVRRLRDAARRPVGRSAGGQAGSATSLRPAVIAAYPTIEALLAALEDPSADVPHRGKLEAADDYLRRGIAVVRVRKDVPLPSVDTRTADAGRRPRRTRGAGRPLGSGRVRLNPAARRPGS